MYFTLVNVSYTFPVSLFELHPDLQPKYFPFLHDQDDLATLGDHGVKTIGSVGALVACVEKGDDEELVKAIQEANA